METELAPNAAISNAPENTVSSNESTVPSYLYNRGVEDAKKGRDLRHTGRSYVAGYLAGSEAQTEHSNY